MHPATAVVLAVSVPALAWAWKRRHEQGSGRGLVVGQAYRLRVTVDAAYADAISRNAPQDEEQTTLERAVANDVMEAGFAGATSVTEDPSVRGTFTLLAKALTPTMGRTRSEITITSAEPVDTSGLEALAQPSNPSETGLDAGLSTAEVHAVGFALTHDSDPRRLDGFAETFDGDFPIAASVLHAKARLETLARQTAPVSGRRPHPDQTRAVGALRKRGLPVRVRTSGWFSDITDIVVKPASAIDPTGVVDSLRDATKSLGDDVSNLWDKYGGAVETLGGWVPGPQIWLVETAVKTANAIDSGQNVGQVLSGQALRFAQGLRQTAPLLAYVPGLGQGVAVMLTAASVLATCGLGGGCPPLDEAAVDLVASQIPGGEITQGAFRAAVTTGYGVARGETWDQAAVEGARAALPSDEARVAFDAGLALSRGELLSREGFQTLYQLARGSGLVDKALDFAKAIELAAVRGVDVKTSLLDNLSASISAAGLSPMDVKVQLPKALSAIQVDPTLLQMWPEDLASALQIAEPIANVALGAFQDLGNGVVVVDPDVSRKFLPQITASSAALLAASSQFAPKRAGISSPYAMSVLLNSFTSDNADVFASLREQQAVADALARARRTLDRQNWVAWYKKIEDLGMMPA